MPIGEKRNLANSLCRGKYICVMDSDDYSFPHRIEQSVKALQDNPQAMITGSSKMYLYFESDQSLYTTHRFHDNHLTNGTFCYRKELLNITKYDNKAKCSEEKRFLLDYKVPVIQLPHTSTIVILAHDSNTFDKRKLKGTEAIEKCEEQPEDVIPSWFLE